MWYFLGLLLALFCTSCGSSAKISRAKAPDDIREAVFRYQFAQFQRTGEHIFFLTISGEDPSDEFMKRFGADTASVRKGSEINPRVRVVEKKTGARAVGCAVGAIKWTGDKTVELPASYRVGTQSAALYNFGLKWEQGNWKITSRKFMGVSAPSSQ
jgi:hypothetical protein